MAFPCADQDDYTAVKVGIAKDRISGRKASRKEYWKKINKQVSVPDEELKIFVDNIFAKRFRDSSYNTLIKAKKHSRAAIAYYNFINTYYLHQAGDGSGNSCCMAVDKAKLLLKRYRKKLKIKKHYRPIR